MMDKAKAYDEALERARQQRNDYQKELDKTDKNSQLADILRAGISAIELAFPELTESEDEKIRKSLIEFLTDIKEISESGRSVWAVRKEDAEMCKSSIAYLEKQKENIEKEYVFRPLAGTDINTAILQAIRRANEGEHLVLAFNGAYIPVRKGCNANKIVDIYDAFIEKQKEQKVDIDKLRRDLYQSGYNDGYQHGKEDTQKEQESIPNTYGCLNCIKWEECKKGLTPCSGHRLKIVDQKPADDKAFEEWIDSWFKEHKEKAYPQITMDEKEFKNFCRGIRNMYQQKSDWNEEDERMLSRCIKSIECSKKFADSETYKAAKDVEINWLKDISLSLKKHNEAVEKLCSNEWTEEDGKMINTLVSYVGNPSCWNLKCPREKLVAFIESLPKKFSSQSKQEWSEEDKENR